MSTVDRVVVEPLFGGQRLDQADFHERYKAMPRGVKAELIDGVVVMPSPVGDRHGDFCYLAITWLGTYSARTVGLKGGTESTILIHDFVELQPDVHLRVRPDHGGQTRNVDNLIHGCPELVLEAADSSRSYDLGPKRKAYEEAGALEYIVLTIDPDNILWHVREGDQLIPIDPDTDGLYRSRNFPGLWLDPRAFLSEDAPAILAALEQGLATRDHADFVTMLDARRPQESDS